MKTAFAFRTVAVLALVAALAGGCASASDGPCDRGIVTTLYLGRSIPGGGKVSDAALDGFLREVVAPRFPGFTLLDGAGWWTSPGAAAPATEPSAVLQIVRCDEKSSEAALREVGAAYAERFSQESILRTDVRARIDW